MEPKMILENQGLNEIKNMFRWIKKSKKSVDSLKFTPKHNHHCNNYSTHVCLSCNKCWGGKHNENFR